MEQFIAASPRELARVADHLRARRAERSPGVWVEYALQGWMAELNETRPLVRVLDHDPRTQTEIGHVVTYEWVDPAKIIEAGTSRWNEFGSHRPNQVRTIIEHLLDDEVDPEAAITRVLATQGIAHLNRFQGPAGPIYAVGSNGQHRTQAFGLIGAPLIAAIVSSRPQPLRVDLSDVPLPDKHMPATQDSERDDVRRRRVWQGLLARGLVHGELQGEDFDTTLVLHHAAAIWMLLDPDRAAAINQAYARIYPCSLAALGIPDDAIKTGPAWRRWVTSAVT